MARKTLQTSDDAHVQLGDEDHFTEAGLPPAFNPGGDAEFCPNWFGRIMANPANGGFGSAYIEPDEYD